MNILSGRRAKTFREAAALALEEAGLKDMNSEVVDMFTSMAKTEKLDSEADRTISSTIRNRYGSKATWQSERWFVPVPKLHYEGKDIPQLIIDINLFLVATAAVRVDGGSRWLTLVGGVGKPERMVIPMVFLYALLEDDLERFSMTARDADYTTWEIPGTKPVRLSNGFTAELEDMLGREPVADWLDQFGSQGRCLAPLVVGSLLGLAFQDTGQAAQTSSHIVTNDTLVRALEGLAFHPDEAREMVRCAAPYLRADMTLEEAIRITLQKGKGGE